MKQYLMIKRFRLLPATVLTTFLVLPASQASGNELFDTINERLSHMQAVASWKVMNNRAVEDLKREKVVLEAAQRQAADTGLDPDSVTAFFKAQIEAAKDIQFCWIERWDRGEKRPEDVPDLVNDIRPALIRLGEDILVQLAEYEVSLSAETSFNTIVDVECLSANSKRAIFSGLVAIRK